MDNQIDLIRIFTAATQSASLRETATRLGTSPQVVTRAIQQLEERLGETLFHRSTRSVRTRRSGRLLPCARMRSCSWSSDIKLAVSIDRKPHHRGNVVLFRHIDDERGRVAARRCDRPNEFVQFGSRSTTQTRKASLRRPSNRTTSALTWCSNRTCAACSTA
ncbi:helix-turn-helix domain-containing protein [Paraburkholderia panacisoli]|uniref:helix-turn-helix domain-containing protein n=1 Tax=Paraburkholderia panacisoli TaxID=2603818 RepID=UPI001CB73E3A|nr:LysR family transcriptional regulator [Paraburkholderia panacisoli]